MSAELPEGHSGSSADAAEPDVNEEEWEESAPGEEEDEGSEDELAQELMQASMMGLWAQMAQINAGTESPIPPSATTQLVAGGRSEASSDSLFHPPFQDDDHLQHLEPFSPDITETHLPSFSQPSNKVLSALVTIRELLALASKNALVRSMLCNLIIPESGGINVLDTLSTLLNSNCIPKEIALCLYPLLRSLATSELLFPPPPKSNGPTSFPEDTGKRKRSEDPGTVPAKRPATQVQPYSLHLQLDHASSAAASVLEAGRNGPFNPALVASIQYPLYHIFLFAATAASPTEPARAALQEVAGLVQLLGVVSSVPIGGDAPSTGAPWLPAHSRPPASDIATAVFPCNAPACHLVFARLYSMRTHDRTHTAYQPFQCDQCSATFSRNYELRRHRRTHGNKAWQCEGCSRMFASQDGSIQHRALGTPCAEASTSETEAEIHGEADRVRLWNEACGYVHEPTLEEGQISLDTLRSAHAAVLRLLPLMRDFIAHHIPYLAQAVAAPTGDGAPLSSIAAIVTKAQEHLSNPLSQGIDPWLDFSPVGLSAEQTRLLGDAVVNGLSAAQRQAEALSAMEEEEDARDEIHLASETS